MNEPELRQNPYTILRGLEALLQSMRDDESMSLGTLAAEIILLDTQSWDTVANDLVEKGHSVDADRLVNVITELQGSANRAMFGEQPTGDAIDELPRKARFVENPTDDDKAEAESKLKELREQATELLALVEVVKRDVGAKGSETEVVTDEPRQRRASTDYRSIHWYGETYTFTANQACVIKLLFENFENGTPEVGQETLLAAVDPESPPARMLDLFRNHLAWSSIIKAGTKGSYRLVAPE